MEMGQKHINQNNNSIFVEYCHDIVTMQKQNTLDPCETEKKISDL